MNSIKRVNKLYRKRLKKVVKQMIKYNDYLRFQDGKPIVFHLIELEFYGLYKKILKNINETELKEMLDLEYNNIKFSTLLKQKGLYFDN